MMAERALRADATLGGRPRQRHTPHDDIDDQRDVRGGDLAGGDGVVHDAGQRDIGAGIERLRFRRVRQTRRRVLLAQVSHRYRRVDETLAQIQQDVGGHVPGPVQRIGRDQLPRDPHHLGLEIVHAHLATSWSAPMTSQLGHQPGHQQRQGDPAGITASALHRTLHQRPQQPVLVCRLNPRVGHPLRRISPARRPRTQAQDPTGPAGKGVVDGQGLPLLVELGEQLPHRLGPFVGGSVPTTSTVGQRTHRSGTRTAHSGQEIPPTTASGARGRTVDRARCPGRCPQRARPHPQWRSVRPEGTHRPRSPAVSAADGRRRTARRQPPPAQGPGPHTRARPAGGPGWGSGHRLAVRPGRPPPAPGPPSAPPARLPRPRAAATGRLDPLPRFASVARARCALAFPGCPRPRWAVVETACSRREEPAPPAASTHAGPRSEP